MCGSSSTVPSMVNRGAISNRPPMADTTTIASTKPMALRSSLRWKNSAMPLLRRLEGGAGGGQVRRRLGAGFRRPADRHPDVVGPDDRPQQEQQAPEGARDVVGMHGHDRLDERIAERPALIIG